MVHLPGGFSVGEVFFLRCFDSSEARGEAHDKSDIDLLVLVPKDKITLQDELEITTPLYDIELRTGVGLDCNAVL